MMDYRPGERPFGDDSPCKGNPLLSNTNICETCLGSRKTAGGFAWEYTGRVEPSVYQF